MGMLFFNLRCWPSTDKVKAPHALATAALFSGVMIKAGRGWDEEPAGTLKGLERSESPSDPDKSPSLSRLRLAAAARWGRGAEEGGAGDTFGSIPPFGNVALRRGGSPRNEQ
jgi:hypothetical protein